MSSKILCSCVHCKKIVTAANINSHYKSRKCLESVDRKFPKGHCKHCGMSFFGLSLAEIGCHGKWCRSGPHYHKTLAQFQKAHTEKHEEIVIKTRKTKLDKYGSETFNNPDKQKETKKKKYGDPNFNNRPKAAETSMAIYGVPNPNQAEDVKAKTKKTKKERYGDENFTNLEAYHRTCTERYGTDYRQQFHDKARETMIVRYGVPHAAWVPEIFERQQSHRSTNKKYILPSGIEVTVQGYEPKLLDILFENGYDEKEIQLSGRKAITYVFEGKEHKYHPDIVLTEERTIFEVKSLYYYHLYLEKNLLKKKAAEEAGWKLYFIVL